LEDNPVENILKQYGIEGEQKDQVLGMIQSLSDNPDFQGMLTSVVQNMTRINSEQKSDAEKKKDLVDSSIGVIKGALENTLEDCEIKSKKKWLS